MPEGGVLGGGVVLIVVACAFVCSATTGFGVTGRNSSAAPMAASVMDPMKSNRLLEGFWGFGAERWLIGGEPWAFQRKVFLGGVDRSFRP